MPTRNHTNKRAGFTLIEALMSVVILGGMAAAVSALYISGLDTIDAQGDTMLLDSYLRSRMELVLATPFSSLADGTETVTVRDADYTITWTVAPADLDGDTIAEFDAVSVTVTISETGDTLEAIIVDPQDKLGKI